MTPPARDGAQRRRLPFAKFAWAIAGLSFLAGAAWLLVPAIREHPARQAYAKGMRSQAAGDQVSAFRSYEEAERLGLRSADFFCTYGTLWSRIGNLRKAEAMYLRALEIDRKFAAAHEGIAEIHFRRQDWVPAAEEYAIAASLDRARAARCYVTAGNIYLGLGEPDKARRMFRFALDASPDDEEAKKAFDALEAAELNPGGRPAASR